MLIHTSSFRFTFVEQQLTQTLTLVRPSRWSIFNAVIKKFGQLGYIISKHHGGYPGANWVSHKANKHTKTKHRVQHRCHMG